MLDLIPQKTVTFELDGKELPSAKAPPFGKQHKPKAI